MRGEKYKLSETPFKISVECADGAILTFYFTTRVRMRSFNRRFSEYRKQVNEIINARYRGIYLESDELALIDLYARTELGGHRIEILDVFGVTRELDIGAHFTITARIK